MENKILRKKILKWYKINKRSFIWREYKDPYKIMIAEFMLQRTKASQVEPVYKSFLDKYRNIKSLSSASVEDIYEFTDKLGLHWRASHFIKSSNYIVNNYNGKYPKTRKKLLKIPGIGDYIAGAILTVCYNKPKFVVDSNIARFINRFYGFGLYGEIRRKKQIIKKSKKLFKYKNPRLFLFAILDFTALICKPRKPDCKICFFNEICQYYN